MTTSFKVASIRIVGADEQRGNLVEKEAQTFAYNQMTPPNALTSRARMRARNE